MLITKCDICWEDIKPNELDGGLVRKVERFAMMPGLEKHGSMPTKFAGEEIWNLCQKCQIIVWKFAEDKRDEKAKEKNKPVL